MSKKDFQTILEKYRNFSFSATKKHDLNGSRENSSAHENVMDDIKDRWQSVEDICKYVGVSKDTVYKWINIGGMLAHRLGRLWKFKKAEVDKWVRVGCARSPRNSNQGE